jgi:DNA helicase-2/ATP-dependent DNA helicase PcrA
MRQHVMVQVTQVSDERAEAESVIGLMQQLHQQGRHKWKDMAILYRTNAQSRLFEEQLVSCAMQL